MSTKGFATFISDDLPGFDSLNGSGFFDRAGDWNDLGDDSNPANEMDDGFDEDCFEVIRSVNSPNRDGCVDIYAFEPDSEYEDDDVDVSAPGPEQSETRKETTGTRLALKSSRRRSTGDRPRGEKRRPTAGGTARIRRNRTMDERQESKSSSSGDPAQVRRVKSSDGTTRRLARLSKQSEKPKSKGLDLGAQLNKLESLNFSEDTTSQGETRMRRNSSNKELAASDEVSIVSRGLQSCAGASVGGRRDTRRRRATQNHDLLVRNMQQYSKATDDSGKQDVWKARRSRFLEGAKTRMPLAA